MTEEEQKVFKAAQDALEDATPAGMKVLYFFYFKAFYVEGGNKTKVTEPVTFKLKIDNISELVVKQFIDGEWVELNSAINADGTITIEGAVEGPMAIFVA